MEKKYSKSEAIKAANNFLKKVKELEKKFGLIFNSDTDDVYLNYKSLEFGKVWDSVKIGWDGDGTGIKVTEIIKDKEYYKNQALSKLSEEEISALDLK